MTPDQIYRLLERLGHDSKYPHDLQSMAAEIALEVPELANLPSGVLAVLTDDALWALPPEGINERLDFFLPESGEVNWGETKLDPASEWGTYVEIDLPDEAVVPEFVWWAQTLRGILKAALANTFKRLWRLDSPDDAKKKAILMVWSSGSDAAAILQDPAFTSLQSLPAAQGQPCTVQPGVVFQVSGRVANQALFTAGASKNFPCCLVEKWTVSADQWQKGLDFRDNRFQQWGRALIDCPDDFLGGIAGWTPRDPLTFYAVIGYSSTDNATQCQATPEIAAFDQQLDGLATRDEQTTWAATVVGE